MNSHSTIFAGLSSTLLCAPAWSDDLVGHWKMESANGPVVVDSATAGNTADDGSWIGPASYIPGVFGEAMGLDGSQHLDIPHSPDTNKAGEDTTISGWIRVDVWDTDWQCVLAKGEGGRYRIARGAGSADTISYSGGGGDLFSDGVNDGSWHHVVAVTEDGVEARLYLDGVRRATLAVGSLDDTGAPLLIGANPESASSRRWKGGIDDVGLFNQAFGDATVTSMFSLATDAAYQYDLATFNQLLNHYEEGPGGGALVLGNHTWSYEAADPGDGRAFFAMGDDGSGVAALESAIYAFTATPSYIASGQSSVLEWDTSGLAGLTIDDGTGPVDVDALPSLTVGPATTTTYTLTGTGPQGDLEQEVVVSVDTAPSVTLGATREAIETGAATTLLWTSAGAEILTIDQGVGDVLPHTDSSGNGSLEIPSVPSTLTYTITATNPFGSTTDSVTVRTGALPVINAFTISNETPVPGETIGLSWNLTGAEAAQINPGVGAIDPVTGTESQAPAGTTTYLLTASNEFGFVTATVTATVPKVLGVDAALWTVEHRTSNGTISNLADADDLLAGVNLKDAANVSDVPVINYGPGDSGEFSGDTAPPLGDDLDDFVVRATATLVVNFPATYVFGINNDEGGRLRIDGADVIVDDATAYGPLTTNATGHEH